MRARSGFQKGTGALGVAAVVGLILTASAEGQEWTVNRQVRLESQQDGLAVIRAIEGALHRLEDDVCRSVLSEFTDSDGRRLEEVLEAREESAEDRLRKLLFYDRKDSDRKDSSRCGSLSPLAATAPGSRVVFVCGRDFRHAAERSPVRAQAIVIHELLHSLGLGENPPTSMEITNAVLARCAS